MRLTPTSATCPALKTFRLIPLLQQLRDEALRPACKPAVCSGYGHAIAVHLARNYIALSEDAHSETSALPGFKLRRITDWMAEHLSEEFSLTRVTIANDVGYSNPSHFAQLFRKDTGLSRPTIASALGNLSDGLGYLSNHSTFKCGISSCLNYSSLAEWV